MLTVAIGDNHTQFAEALSAYLGRKLGANCRVAESYLALCALAIEQRPDIILISSRLPGASCDKSLQRLRGAAGEAMFIMVREPYQRIAFGQTELVAVVSKAHPALAVVDALLTLLHGNLENWSSSNTAQLHQGSGYPFVGVSVRQTVMKGPRKRLMASQISPSRYAMH